MADKYEDLATRMRAADAATADGGANARERLRAQAHAYCLFAREYPGHYRLMYEVRQPPVPTARLHLHPSRHVSLSLREAFARCREAGYPLSMPDEQAAQTLWAGLHGFIALQHTLSRAEQAQEPVEPLADGLVDTLIPAKPADERATAGGRHRSGTADPGDSLGPGRYDTGGSQLTNLRRQVSLAVPPKSPKTSGPATCPTSTASTRVP